jgi:GTP-binding protein HflX
MFATLDPTTRRLRLPREREVIVNDTVGFIRDLPPDLLEAFRSTLEEIEGSRLLIHVVDAANARWPQQIASVHRILGELKFDRIPQVLVLNKVDLLAAADLEATARAAAIESGAQPIAISANDRKTLTPLLDQIERALPQELGDAITR